MSHPFTTLPQAGTFESYCSIYRGASVWLPAMREICRRHSLNAATLDLAPPGSNVVFWVERDYLIKLFPPFFAGDYERERLVLAALAPQTAFEVPRICFSGVLEGWPYLVLSKLNGSPLDAIWPDLDGPTRLRIASGLGRMIAALHRTSVDRLENLGPAWAEFIREQADTCLERQRAAGASAAWLADVAAYFDGFSPLPEPDFRPVLINADLNPEHIFCRKTALGWEVSGMIDFGDAMLGHPDYEFVCPGLIFAGQPDLRREMLRSYGLPPSALDESLSRRLTAFILLHRFIDVTQFADLFPRQPPRSMAELEKIAWSF